MCDSITFEALNPYVFVSFSVVYFRLSIPENYDAFSAL